MTRRGHNTCARKRRYVSETDARIAATRNERKAGVTLYVYACRACDGWHCTKQAPQRAA